MVQSANSFPAVNAILSGPNWPGRVRVVRVEPRGASRVLVEAVTLDEQAHLISCVFRLDELSRLQVEATDHALKLDGDPRGFKLAAEATRIRLAYT